MIKTKTFVVKYSTAYHGTEFAAQQLDDMINKFIEEKTTENTSFQVINIQYSTTVEGERAVYWYPSAMLVYEEA